MAANLFWDHFSWRKSLSQDKVHIFRAKIDEVSDSLLNALSVSELERAARFSLSVDKLRFSKARAWLRYLLAQYCEMPANQIEFEYGASGKPFLKAPTLPIKFNLSHSKNEVIAIFSSHQEVGVDIEILDEQRVNLDILTESERLALTNLPLSQRVRAFFFIWTQKESYLKALGDGLRINLSSIEVSLDPQRPARLLKGYRESDEKNWRMISSQNENNLQWVATIHSETEEVIPAKVFENEKGVP